MVSINCWRRSASWGSQSRMPVGGPIAMAAYPSRKMATYQADRWKASLMPVRTNCTAIAARIKPMTRVKIRIPVSFNRRVTAVALRSTTKAITTLRAMASISSANAGRTFGDLATWPVSAITLEIVPGPLNNGMASGMMAISSRWAPSASSSGVWRTRAGLASIMSKAIFSRQLGEILVQLTLAGANGLRGYQDEADVLIAARAVATGKPLAA